MPEEDKLSVVQIIDRLHAGGAERVLVTLANVLQQHGHSVKVITIVSAGPLAKQLHEEILFKDLKRKWKWNPVTMHRLIKEVKGYDVIHVHSSFNLRYLYLASKLFGCKKSVFFHEHYGDIDITQAVSWHQKLVYPKTILIAVSKKLEDWALHRLKMSREKVFLLQNTVAVTAPEPSRQNVATDRIKLLMVANIRPTKNIEFALQLLQQLNKAEKKFFLTIIGKRADIAYLKKIKRKIHFLQLNEIVNFIHDCDDVQPWLHQFHLAIHTAISESGPLALIEYMAHGIPFISYETGEVVAQIKPDLPEMIMDNFDMDKWMAKINFLLDGKNYELLSKRMKDAFQKYYSLEAYYEACIHIYQKGLSIK